LVQKILKHRTPVLLAFDPEMKAQRKQRRLAELLSGRGINVRILQYPGDSTDVGGMTSDEFQMLASSAKLYSRVGTLRDLVARL